MNFRRSSHCLFLLHSFIRNPTRKGIFCLSPWIWMNLFCIGITALFFSFWCLLSTTQHCQRIFPSPLKCELIYFEQPSLRVLTSFFIPRKHHIKCSSSHFLNLHASEMYPYLRALHHFRLSTLPPRPLPILLINNTFRYSFIMSPCSLCLFEIRR